MKALHCEMGIPITPFLAQLVIVSARHAKDEKFHSEFSPFRRHHLGVTHCDRFRSCRCTDTVTALVISCEDWLRVERRNATTTSNIPFFDDGTVRRIWFRTLINLRDEPTSTTKVLINLWLRFGSAHGLSERTEREWLAQGDRWKSVPASPLPWGHCAWRKCICYEQKPLYQLAACKGCWRVYYCGEACQRQ